MAIDNETMGYFILAIMFVSFCLLVAFGVSGWFFHPMAGIATTGVSLLVLLVVGLKICLFVNKE